MSESRGDGQPEASDPSQSSSSPQESGRPQNHNGPAQDSPGPSRPGGQDRTDASSGGRSQPGGRSRGSDPIADFQRWLMKAGARGMANQVADQVKRTIGTERRSSGDVWDTATNEPPPNEPPECQWCPICQAARAARNGGAAGIGAQLANAGGVLASVVQDAFSAFEQVMKTQDQDHSAERARSSPPPKAASDPGETKPAPEAKAAPGTKAAPEAKAAPGTKAAPEAKASPKTKAASDPGGTKAAPDHGDTKAAPDRGETGQ